MDRQLKFMQTILILTPKLIQKPLHNHIFKTNIKKWFLKSGGHWPRWCTKICIL